MDKVIIKRAENLIKEQLFGGFIIVATVVMIMNSLGYVNLVQAGNQNNTNLSINITSGTFSVDNAEAQMNFTDQTYPTTNYVECNQEFDNIAVTDQRGTDTAWVLSVNSTSMTGGTYNILSTKLHIENNAATVIGTTHNHVTIGANSTLDGAGGTMMNGTTQASGINTYHNGKLFLNLDGSPSADDYTGTIHYTLV